MNSDFAIAGRPVGGDGPCFIIAEAGVNHNGDPGLAEKLIDAAAESGANAVKFQTFEPELVIDPRAPKAAYQKKNTGAEQSQLDMVRELELPKSAWAGLKAAAERRGLIFLSTPFDRPSAALLMKLGMAAIKVPSGELINLPFVDVLAGYGVPLIVSTGMANLAEVAQAVSIIERHGVPYCLLHCVSNYPAAAEDSNLRAMQTLASAFGVPVGYSDHTLGATVSLGAAAMGARIIEKHLTLDCRMTGPDHSASMEPGPFKALVRDIRIIESAFGDGRKRGRPAERDVTVVARKSLIAARALAVGEIVGVADFDERRVGHGLSPSLAHLLYGRRVRRAKSAGDVLDFSDFDLP